MTQITETPRSERGQILVLFAIAMTAMLIALALLFDGAQSLVLRRQLQNTADAAALAGANIVQVNGSCTAALVAKSPAGAIYIAVRQSVMDNLGVTSAQADTLLTKPDGSNGVECATDQSWYNNYAVAVTLKSTNPTYFGAIAGIHDIGVSTTATAFNGPVNGGKFSVVMLDPCHNGICDPESFEVWPTQRNGCASVSFNGGPTVTFEGDVQSDSRCLYNASLNFTGAVGTSGSGNAAITLANTSSGQATIRMVGTYNPAGFSNITPSGQIFTNQPSIKDVLADLPIPVAPTSGANAWLQCPSLDPRCPDGATDNKVSSCFVLSPGIYTGGINVTNNGEAYMKPGIYIMNGGGLTNKGKLYTISSNPTYPTGSCGIGFLPESLITILGVTYTTWELTLCPQATTDPPTGSDYGCGVMIYNKCSAATPTTGTCTENGSNPIFGPLDLSGGSGLRLRAFCASAATNVNAICTSPRFVPPEQLNSNTAAAMKRYRNLVFWQTSQPDPTSSWAQPDLTFRGGGTAFLQGTVYAPSAFVNLGGNCGGAGGSAVDLTLQFVSYDMQISGSCSYTFRYRTNSFATPSSYGLVH